MADASHELKTPLTVILTNTGILLAHSGGHHRTAAEMGGVYPGRGAADARPGGGPPLLGQERRRKGDCSGHRAVDVSELTWSALLPFEPVAFEQGVEMESEIADQLTVQGNADQLRRLVAILLDNAVKYAGNGGRVKLVLSRRSGAASA